MTKMSHQPNPRSAAVVCAILLAGMSLAAVAVLRAQDAGAVVIHTETRTVLVNAVAIDKKGKFVDDLTEKDFRIWEDNKEQKISGFSLESSGVSPERPTRHYIAMFFDTSTAGQTGQMTVRQEGIRFVNGFASPDRYMAVINYNFDGGLRIAQNFTTDRDLITKALGIVQASSNSTPVAAGGAPPAPVPTRGGRGNTPAPAAPAANTFAYRDMLASLRNLAESLGNIRGRKALVLFTGGVPLTDDLSDDLTATIDACNKANVAVYTVGPGAGGGVSSAAGSTDVSAPPTVGRTSRNVQMPLPDLGIDERNQSIPASLSEGTGGIAFTNTNDLAASLGKVAREQDEYYLLSYTPLVESAEGSCHELKVKADRGDLEVRARKSYCTSRPVDLLSGKPVGKDLETRAAGKAAGNMAAKMQLPWFYTAPNVARVNLAMDIVPTGTKFQKEKGKYHGEIDLAGVAYKSDGTAAARVSDEVKLDFDNQQKMEAFLKTPYHYENQFDIAPGQYTFRMAFASGPPGASDAQAFGKVEMPLDIDPWNGQTLAVSGIALSHDAHPAADLAAGLDVSLLEGLRPLVAKNTEVVPSGVTRFETGQPGYFYFEAYEPLLAAATQTSAPLPLIGVRIRVLDRSTGRQKSDTGVHAAGSFERRGNPVVPVVSSLPIQGLPPGAYKLEISVMRQTGDPVVRTADFDVN